MAHRRNTKFLFQCNDHIMAPKAYIDIRNARVLIVEMKDYWFAQCLDIDYCAQGNSLEDVKQSFQNGLMATIQLHLNEFGNLDNFLKPPPHSVRDDLVDPAKHSLDVIGEYEIQDNALPYFDHIQYLAAKENIAA